MTETTTSATDITSVDTAATPPVADAVGFKPPTMDSNLLADATADAAAADAATAAEPAAAAAAADAAAEAPIVYEPFKLPEGIEIDPAKAEQFTAIAQELKLDQAGAQKLVDFHASQIQEIAAAPYQLWVDTQKAWQQEIFNDPEIGGANLPQFKATIARALDRFGDAATREALVFTGAGNNPAIARFFFKMANALAEGTPTPTGTPAAGAAKKSTAEILYPSAT